MGKQLANRLAWAIPILLFVSFFVFVVMDLAPGDVAVTIGGTDASPEVLQNIRDELNLDRPFFERYGEWLANAAQGDLGESLVTQESVSARIWAALPISLSLVGVSMAIALVIALVLGAGPILFPNTWLDRASTLLSSLSISMPSFWVALLLTTWLAVSRPWFPALGYVPFTENPWEWLRHLLLPATALGLATGGELARQLRAGLEDEMQKDYAMALRARGISRRKVVLKHGLKNGAVPVVTILGVRIAQILGGTVIIEQIFLIDGLGRLMVGSVLGRDVPIVLGIVVVTTMIVLLANLLVDLSYGYFNPRVRSR